MTFFARLKVSFVASAMNCCAPHAARRDIAYFGEERERLNQIWREVFDDQGVPEGLSEEFKRRHEESTQAVRAADEKEHAHAIDDGRVLARARNTEPGWKTRVFALLNSRGLGLQV